jgi:predicted DNA-binding protein
MKKSTTNVKRKMGRPVEIGAEAAVGIRLPQELLDRIDDWSKRKKLSRSQGIRVLLTKALEK